MDREGGFPAPNPGREIVVDRFGLDSGMHLGIFNYSVRAGVEPPPEQGEP
jgi:hypothetical protein